MLDTKVLLWVATGDPRVAHLRGRMTDPDNEVYGSEASFWEVAFKAGIGKLDADVAQLRLATQSVHRSDDRLRRHHGS